MIVQPIGFWGGGAVDPLAGISFLIRRQAQTGFGATSNAPFSLFQDNTLLVPAILQGAVIEGWTDPLSLTPDATNSSDTNIRLDLSNGFPEVQCNNTGALDLPSSLNYNDFVLYWVGRRAANKSFFPIGGFAGASEHTGVGIHTDNNFYVIDSVGTFASGPYTGTNGLFAVRITSTSGVAKAAGTGMAEATLSGTTAFPFIHRGILSRETDGNFTDGSISAIYLAGSLTAGEKTTIENFIAATWGVTIG